VAKYLVFGIIGKQVIILYGLAAVNGEFVSSRHNLGNNHWLSISVMFTYPAGKIRNGY
jgi:hypothetical protein